MTTKLAKKIFVGFFVGLLALIIIFCSLLLRAMEVFNTRLFYITVGIAGLGLMLLALGYSKQRRVQDQPTGTEVAGTDEHEQPLAFFTRLEFWGTILVLSALPVYFWTESAYHRPKVTASISVAHKSRKPAVAPPVKVTPHKLPVLHLQGFVCDGSNSTAVINGQTWQAGQLIDGIRIVAVTTNGVEVKLPGQSGESLLQLN